MEYDEQAIENFMARMVGEFGAVASAPLIALGDRLGLYKAMTEQGWMTSLQLAARTQMAERYVREWLGAQAASGIIDYDATTQCFRLSNEMAMCFAVETSPTFVPGFSDCAEAMFRALPKLEAAFRTGLGVGWHEHHSSLFKGIERFFRPGYAVHLVAEWIPSMEGVAARLARPGARVADVGCGHGASTILMAQAYPQASFFGFDYHAPSIERARAAANEAGVRERLTFEVASAQQFTGKDYDLVTFFDCLHDMGDPVGAAAHVLKTLAPDGSWMIVEPFAGDRLEDNLNPVGCVYYSGSTMFCTGVSLSQEGRMALGAQAGEVRIRDVVTRGGFKRFRRTTQTPFNMVFQAQA
ncbi:class I SAM-dependent methyltransferase [Caballeronia sp. AZ7_KS35]|uniref:class I SAM-dependent methyltransferase n=1 Tax=Caballeronia sp. AZ7_KS35 TaxID=2921762 RepID=UPI00202859ED|nr:class I SAM-dependent methyltransferase [Caballeronia sp. AZ7_KS35]